MVKGSQAEWDTHSRLYVPASNIERQPEQGCMKKIKLERSLKLRKEDLRNKGYNILSNIQDLEGNWLNSFGSQKETFYPVYKPPIENTHEEKSQIASGMTDADRENEKRRLKFEYLPKRTITHSSSIRYTHIPKDH